MTKMIDPGSITATAILAIPPLPSRATKIRFNGQWVAGTGVTLRVILHAFQGMVDSWYSVVYGEYHDNVLVIALDDESMTDLPRIPYEEMGPVQTASRGELGFSEFQLTDEILQKLGIDLNDDTKAMDQSLIKYRIQTHDDYFFFVEPIDDGLLRRLIEAVLGLHSFYLEKDVDWTNVVLSIAEMVTTGQNVLIRSLPARQELDLSFYERRGCLTFWLPDKAPAHRVVFPEGSAFVVDD